MRILMVSHYPPLRDGIAAYAQQTVRALRAEGHHVEVLSPGPSAAHHHLDLVGPRGALALAKRVRNYDKIIVQFHPDMFYPLPPTSTEWMKESLALLVAFRRARQVEVVVHEIDYRLGRATTPDGQAARRLWNSVDRIYVHTEQDRKEFSRAFAVPPSRIHITDHGADFVPRTRFEKAGARRSLNIPDDEFMFLSIGFVLPNKGFDRAVRAFAGLGQRNARLDIVGSVRLGEPELVAYAENLEELIQSVDSAHLHQGFVSDEMFDRWIVATDVVVLPYRFVFTSGVMERALLYKKPVIATMVGAMADQAAARAGVTLVCNDQELKVAMWSAVGATSEQQEIPWPADGVDLRAQVQREVLDRAAATRGLRPHATGDPTGASREAARAASASVRRVPTLQMPPPTSARPFASVLKKAVRRLTAWELEPVVAQLNALQNATAKAVEDAVIRATSPTDDVDQQQPPAADTPPLIDPRGQTHTRATDSPASLHGTVTEQTPTIGETPVTSQQPVSPLPGKKPTAKPAKVSPTSKKPPAKAPKAANESSE